MKRSMLLLLPIALFAFIACENHTNHKSVADWSGTYTGEVPGANSAIRVEITLNSDETYKAVNQYMDKSGEIFESVGSFRWQNASVIILDGAEFPPYYKVGKNSLTQLDMQGEPISGKLADQYVLKKK
ncbi:hypothetical protein AGMMS49521_0500 [Campylobacterota bacterium]|nr:hypothetical protein AGMMS49521_0500 [Campylobacterota bacterium]